MYDLKLEAESGNYMALPGVHVFGLEHVMSWSQQGSEQVVRTTKKPIIKMKAKKIDTEKL